VAADSGALGGRHALVTGASGFVGANLVRTLLRQGCSVTAAVRRSSDLWRLREVRDRIGLRAVDLADEGALHELPAADTADLVFHAAAEGVRPGGASAAVVEANLRGSMNLLALLAKRGECQRLVFLSSCSVYGPGARLAEDAPLRGSGVYAHSKIAGEALCATYNAAGLVPSVVLRLYTPYGPWEAGYRFVAGTMLRAMRGEEMPLTGGEQSRDFIYIDDATAAIAAAGSVQGLEGEVLNVCTGVSTTIRDGVEAIVAVTGSGARPRFGALPYRADETWEMSGDPGRMRERLGVGEPVPFVEGVRRTSVWLASRSELYQGHSG